MLRYMLCCLVHVSTRMPRVQGPIWWKRWKFQFSLFNFNFLSFSSFTPLLSLPSTLRFHSFHIKQVPPFSFPLKPSPSSPLQNSHHLWRSTLDFWRKNLYVVKVTSFLFFLFFFFSIRFHPFFVLFFIFRFQFLSFRFQL